MTPFETAAGDRYVKWISHYRAENPLFRHPCGASQLKERRRYHQPCAYLFLLGAGLDVMLGLLDETKTADNLARVPECVINIPSPEMWQKVEKLAPLTGKNPVPDLKTHQFHFEPDKFGVSGLKPMPSEVVKPERVQECPVHLESRVVHLHTLSGERLNQLGGGIAAEVEVLRVHVAEEFVLGENHIDPQKWSPLIYNFRHYFRLADKELGKTFRAER